VNPTTTFAILTGVLVLITAYYAWTTHRLIGSVQDMVAATKEMVDVASKTYALTVAPQVVCRTVILDSSQVQAADVTAGDMVSETTITNVGPHRVRLSRVCLETDSHAEHVRRFLARWLVTNDGETVQIPFGKSKHARVLVHLEDMSGQQHVVVAQQSPAPASDEEKRG
jgi:hypothetical protein